MDPICSTCNQAIQGDVLRWGILAYHLNHLHCTKCSVQLGSGSSIKNFSGKPYCPNCWNDVFWGPGKAPSSKQTAPPPKQAPTPTPTPVVAPAVAPVVVSQPAAAPPLVVAPAHPMKDQIEGAAVLKHVQPSHDASAPKIESTVQVKKVDREAFKAQVSTQRDLKHVESTETHDVSAPKIDTNVHIKTRPIMERQVFLNSVEKAASSVASASPLEKAIKNLETSLRMVDASAKSVETNKQNMKDAENKAPGAGTVEDAKKTFATAEDLFNTQLKNTQVRYNVAANEVDRNRSQLTGDLQQRWNKLLIALKQHGLNVV